MHKPTRIIFSNYDDIHNPYYAGGGAHAIHEVSKRLAKKHRVTVITAQFSGAKNEVIDGVSYKRIGWKKAGPKLGQVLFLLLLPYYAWKLQKEYDVWFESFTPPVSTSCIPLFTKKRVVGVLHNLAASEMQKKYHLPFSLFERIGLRTYSELIALTSYKEKVVRSLGFNKKVWLIPNGVEQANILKKKTITPYVFFIGRLDIIQKGIDLLLAAFAQVSNNIPHKLILAGDTTPQQVETIRSLITQHNLTNKVTLLGKVSGTQKAELFSNAELLVLPSRFEGQGITFLEGLSYQKPIVCFDIQDLVWLDASVVYKCAPVSANSLAKGITTLINNPKVTQKIVAAIAATHTQYLLPWSEITKKYEDVLKVG